MDVPTYSKKPRMVVWSFAGVAVKQFEKGVSPLKAIPGSLGICPGLPLLTRIHVLKPKGTTFILRSEEISGERAPPRVQDMAAQRT